MREKDNYWLRLRGRRLTRRSFLAGTGVAAAGSAAILAGCGDDDDDDDAGPAATQAAATQAAATEAAAAEAEAEATEAAAAATEAPAAADSRRGGTFRTWKSTEDQGLDPAIYHTNNGEVTAKVYNHLLDFQVSKGVFGLDAATGFEQIDETTLVWAMREGMKFHNGDRHLRGCCLHDRAPARSLRRAGQYAPACQQLPLPRPDRGDRRHPHPGELDGASSRRPHPPLPPVLRHRQQGAGRGAGRQGSGPRRRHGGWPLHPLGAQRRGHAPSA